MESWKNFVKDFSQIAEPISIMNILFDSHSHNLNGFIFVDDWTSGSLFNWKMIIKIEFAFT